MAICEYAYNCKTNRENCIYCVSFNKYNPKDRSIKTPQQISGEIIRREGQRLASEASKRSKSNVKAGRKSEEKGVHTMQKTGMDSKQVFMSGAGAEKGDFTILDDYLVENKREKGFNKMYKYLDKIKEQAKASGRLPLLRIDTKGKYPVYCMSEYIFKAILKELENKNDR